MRALLAATLLAAFGCGERAGTGADADGLALEDVFRPETSAPPDVAEADDSIDPPELIGGVLGTQIGLNGLSAPQDSRALAIASGPDEPVRWVLAATTSEYEAVSVTRDDVSRDLFPWGDRSSFLLLPIDHDGLIGTPREIAPDAPGDVSGFGVYRCGEHLWGAAWLGPTGEVIFRASLDLSRIDYATAAQLGAGEGSAGVRYQGCSEGTALFAVAGGGSPIVLLPPLGDVIELPGREVSARLIDASRLMDRGELGLFGTREGQIQHVAAAAGGALIAIDRPKHTVMRWDLASGEARLLAGIALEGERSIVAMAEMLEGPERGRYQAVCAILQSEVRIGAVTIRDPEALSFCVIVADDRVLHGFPVRGDIAGAAFHEGLLWLSGASIVADPLLGNQGAGSTAFIIGIDPATGEGLRRGLIADPASHSHAVEMFPARGEGSCSGQASMALRAQSLTTEGWIERVALATEPGATTCQHGLAGFRLLDPFLSQPPLVSETAARSCASTRYLAVMTAREQLFMTTPDGEALETPAYPSSDHQLVVFEPAECVLSRD